ncbi:MAG: shikimate dehydrogenase, partial [Terriglobales bacterium]
MAATVTYVPRLLPARMPRICVAIVGANPAQVIAKAAAIIRDNPFVEFRLDYLRKPTSALSRIRSFLESHPEV